MSRGGTDLASAASNRRATRGRAVEDLPPDNAARIAIYDVMPRSENGPVHPVVTEAEILDHVMPRLRLLVPRELHNEGEASYLARKLDVCVRERILERTTDAVPRYRLGTAFPRIRYPDGSIRDYVPGLEAAKARIDADNSRLARQGFKISKAIPSIADRRKSEPFQALVASMREHGWMRQFPVTEGEDGEVVDGRARVAAAELVGVTPTRFLFGQAERRSKRERRDTPLHRFLMARDANRERLTDDDLATAHQVLERLTGRAWTDVERDLAITQGWRLRTRTEFASDFEVTKHPFRPGDEPTVQVTLDGKIMVRSLLEAAGLASYKYKDLEKYAQFEYATTQFTGGKRAHFIAIADAAAGIEAMQKDRADRGLRTDRRWDDVRTWLVQRLNEE